MKDLKLRAQILLKASVMPTPRTGPRRQHRAEE
jgi:hypothetical protein